MLAEIASEGNGSFGHGAIVHSQRPILGIFSLDQSIRYFYFKLTNRKHRVGRGRNLPNFLHPNIYKRRGGKTTRRRPSFPEGAGREERSPQSILKGSRTPKRRRGNSTFKSLESCNNKVDNSLVSISISERMSTSESSPFFRSEERYSPSRKLGN